MRNMSFSLTTEQILVGIKEHPNPARGTAWSNLRIARRGPRSLAVRPSKQAYAY